MIINIAGGRGVMGKVHKPVFENAGHRVIISGRNSSPTLEEAAQQSDLTIISVPISATREVIRKIATYCKAIMDFTGLKVFPIQEMLNYSRQKCEVGGLHPLYGDVPSIKGKTVVYCKTKKSGKSCQEIVESLREAGAEIVEMSPSKHDLVVGGISQIARLNLLNAYALVLEKSGITAEELYRVSPPPTRIMLDLLARQADHSNDDLYSEMESHNPHTREVMKSLLFGLEGSQQEGISKRVRALFGDDLKSYQDRARKIIDAER